MAGKVIVESVTDALAVASNIVESATNEVVWLLPPEMLIFSTQFGIAQKCKTLIENGGRIRGITQITDIYHDVIQQRIDYGEEIRHIDRYQGSFMLVGDKEESISSIYLDLEKLSLDDALRAFWTDNEAYAAYLMSTFEFEWNGAVDAKKKLQELQKERF
ncbi:MAG: hypothetical protein ACXV5N_12905 [Halobacteriota archaeon]